MKLKLQLEQLAVMFRTNDPNINHVSTLDLINQVNLGYPYGIYRGTPRRYTKIRQSHRECIAKLLTNKANLL